LTTDILALTLADMKNKNIAYHGRFRDAVVFDSTQKTAVSVRDGILEYAGFELGMTPPDKMFRVYRSPATISNTAMKMAGIPITDEHVSLDVSPPTEGGTVASAEMVDLTDHTTKTTIAIMNKLQLSDSMKGIVEAGKRELSLGYSADLVMGEGDYDFEQVNIMPHHLAAVDRGRCGSICSFLDKKVEGETMKKGKLHGAFVDADGALNLQQVVELATSLPEAIKSVPVDKLGELIPALQAIVEASSSVMPEEKPLTPNEGEGVKDDGGAVVKEPDGDEAKKNEKKFSDAVAAKAQVVAASAMKHHGEVIDKARHILDAEYVFTGKTTNDIMRDALAVESDVKFEDAELPIAFKMLKKTVSNYQDFAGKGAGSGFDKLADKEI